MKKNIKLPSHEGTTHEGAPARRISPLAQLRRSIISCLLWEKEYYESGETIATRIAGLIASISDTKAISKLAIEARSIMNLRHMPLFIVREMARHPQHRHMVASTLAAVIQRADELAEFLALYWLPKKEKLAASVKKGLAMAFTKFNAHQLAKYNRDGAVKLRDVLFLCHAKPLDEEQAATWKQLIAGTLPIADTWETALSAGKDKKETWERLMLEKQLGGLALLRNLRNMKQAGVDPKLMALNILAMDTARILPFRFIAAARFAPELEPELETAMFKSIKDDEAELEGTTLILVDVSGSMDQPLSAKSDMRRIDAACGVAMVLREMAEKVIVHTFSTTCVQVPSRRGFALRDAIVASQPHSSTHLGAALHAITDAYDRIVVITDEQSADDVPAPKGKGYVINVASAKNGIGYGPWTHIDGFSEGVVRYLIAYEADDGNED